MSGGDSEKDEGKGFSVEDALNRASRFLSTAAEHTYNTVSTYGPSLTQFEFLTKPLEGARAKADETLYTASDTLNNSLPAPLPSMMRSHSLQLTWTTSMATGLLFAYPVRKISGRGFFKTFAVAGILTGAAVGSLTELIKYKWNYPRKI